MQDFLLWLKIGFEHITDLSGYDHMLFVVLLAATRSPNEWKNMLILISAFTIGHSITLLLSTLKIITLPSEFIEFLIPLTILITASLVIINKERAKLSLRTHMILIGFFGFVHGLGFSNLLKSMLGREESIIGPLFSFNLGIELGQLSIVILVLVFSLFLHSVFKVRQTSVNLFIGITVFCVSLYMVFERFVNLINS